MSIICQITGKSPQYGHRVSKSNRKTKRRFIPNLHMKKIWSPKRKKFISMRISTSAVRLLDKMGGLDNFLSSNR